MAWVMFDFGGVICTAQPEQDVAALAAVAGATAGEFAAAYWPSRRAYDAAALTTTAYWQDVARRLGTSFTGTQVAGLTRLDVASWQHLQDGTVRLLGDLRARGERLALLSNAPHEVARGVAGLPVAGYFEHLLFSCDFRSAKPDPGCFGQALDRLDAPAEEVIFIDDREENVRAAARLGMRAIWFTGPEQARASLTGMLGPDGLLPLRDTGGPSLVRAVQKLSVRSETC